MSGLHSSVIRGGENTVDRNYFSISGELQNQIDNLASYNSKLGGNNHEIKTNFDTSALLSLISTNSTNGQMIQNHHPEEHIRSLEDHPSLTCTETLCTSEDKLFLFTEGVVIGKIKPRCDNGKGTLSVDFATQKEGRNCPK